MNVQVLTEIQYQRQVKVTSKRKESEKCTTKADAGPSFSGRRKLQASNAPTLL